MYNWKFCKTKEVTVEGMKFHGDFFANDDEFEPYKEDSKLTFRGDKGQTYVSVVAAAQENYNLLCEERPVYDSLSIVENVGVDKNVAILQCDGPNYGSKKNLYTPKISQEILCKAYELLNN